MDAQSAALQILRESKVGTMATVQNGKPYSRYMMFDHDGFTLYTATSKQTEKVDDLQENHHTHILLGYEGDGVGDAYLEISGIVSMSDEPSLKEKIWTDQMRAYFSNPDDPNMIVLKIEPTEMRLMNKRGQPPQTIPISNT